MPLEKPNSRLLSTSILELKDELEERLEKCYNTVQSMLAGLSEREANDVLNSHVSKGLAQHEEVQLGLLFSVLVDPKSAAKSYRDMTLITRDGLNIVLTKANQIVYEKWLKINDAARTQIVWFCKELVRNNVMGADSVCQSLIRQISGGDVTPKNIWLAENMLDVFMEYRSWLEKNGSLAATVVYTYLRVIIDHGAQMFSHLRQREVELCVSILREKWSDCMTIGRDLIRLLQNVARIPDFEKLWKDILHNPTTLCPTFTGVLQLLHTRTSRKFLVARLTPDMENKLVFLISKVKFGQQKRYQDWFQRQYLSTPESQSLRCDIIRYICAVFHPSNELLCSDIIPRWAVIGWLLTTCTSNVAASDAKLALFYDWLLFDPERDSIMNIEPAILVMYHSMRPHPAITATLLDFLCRIMVNYCPMFSAQVKQGIYTSLKTIRDKRVLPSLSPLFDNSKLDRDLRSLLREHFTEFCSHEVVIKEDLSEKSLMEIDNRSNIGENHLSPLPGNMSDARFSDEDDDSPTTTEMPEFGKPKQEIEFVPIEEPTKVEPVDISEQLGQLSGDLRDLTAQLQSESDQELQCETIDRLMQAVIQEEEFDTDIAGPLAICLCQILSSQLNGTLLPDDVDDETIEDSIGRPLYVMFRFLSQMSEEDPRRQPLLLLLGEMYSKQPKIGYHLIYFLKVSKMNEEKMATYKDFCKSIDNKDLETCLLDDLKLCQEDDVRLFTFLIPDIYTHFPGIAIGNAKLIEMIVSCIDGTQLQELICQILQGHLTMFKNKETFLSVLNESLDWETIEQYFLWQLIAAHNIPVEHILPILPKLEYTSHAEAMTSILVLLKQESPAADLVRPILVRECKKSDYFAVSILKYWAQEHEDRLAELIFQQLTKLNGGTPKKRQRTGSSKKENPSVDQVLAHLDHMRQTCRNISFLNHENVQLALQQVQMTASEVQKTKYSDLLALAEDIEFQDIKTTRKLRGGRKGSNTSPKAQKIRKPAQEYTDSDSVSSEDEDMKPKAKKRKKPTPTVDDDSE
ncbi:integrator complex subunit 3-like [Gigantopelta aegis]|uniref:integrator complex subunit 3-like n=1 Tax=Gigantopelta aegis TaxID=1735272 RepID=UPI001B88919B|nr:integrator complex subunit 3-like [Gigantopelta aegis]